MADQEENIKRIYSKLQQLLKQYQHLQKENERLNKELIQNRSQHETQFVQIEQLKQQVFILKTSAGKMDEADKKAFEKNINQYIKQIDKCIGLLSE